MLIFDASLHDGTHTELGTRLTEINDQVMGGLSQGKLTVESVAGRRAARLQGKVRLENNGGFIQMATDLVVDASKFESLRLEVFGNSQSYGCHLRTSDVTRPWQSYRQSFMAPPKWTTVELKLKDFEPHRTEKAFAATKLRRLGLVAIGRAFEADLAVARISFV